MRVARLELKEIGPFEDAVFEIPEPEGPGELVLFEGPNGCGKTTIVQAIACAAAPKGPHYLDKVELRPPLDELTRRVRSPKGPQAMTTIEEAGESLIVNDPGNWTKWFPTEGGKTHAAKLILACEYAAQKRKNGPLRWAAFTYRGHQQTPVVTTKGPTEIEPSPLYGALSFGTVDPASEHFGQLLVNLDYEVAKALKEARREGIPSERRAELERISASRQKMLDEIARALSEALGRKVTFDVPVGQHAPAVFVDGEPIPLEFLGEGMRSTFAWLSDLLVRLHRIAWASPEISPLEQDFWLILDEIDESLHPTMQMRILPALRRLFPNARMYVTTHSPFVVASAGEGVVFPIRPDKDHRVRGKVEPRALAPGQSLEWVVTEIFQAQAGFIDQETRDRLDAHKREIRRYQRSGVMDWDAFFARRAELMKLNDEVRTVVAMQEVPVRLEIDRRMLERAEAREQGADA